ncbi:hypothetical protein [Inquilinus sp. Marseille-Q2685]|uniref:hypothetical protein n=1 Tax=Inquilinus sp. Marseille-Q2685 TaxID=2866581 RepID=UPI001CE3CEB3|nr:hypothetical protein [Inquilinus sp. Marseille-Q2685]
MTRSSLGPRHRITAACAAALLLLGAAAEARAALPPYWQRLREIQAILDSNELAQRLRDTPIDRIERPGEDLYRIQAGPCSLDIRIVDDPPDSGQPAVPGPRRFHIETSEAACR